MNVLLLKQRLDLKRRFRNIHSSMNESAQLAVLRKINHFDELLREENLKREQNL